MSDNNCFICLESIDNTNKYIFPNFILNNISCNCYQFNYMHKQCFYYYNL